MNKLKGIFTAIVTPFNSKKEIDWPCFEHLLELQKTARVAGVIPCGTTGESPTLTLDEKKQVIEFTFKTLKNSGLKVIPGTGSNQTNESVAFSKWASEKGADAVLVVTPYYNKPSVAGLLNHYNLIADAVSCDVIIYNVPGRTGTSLSADTIAKLAAHPRLNGLKEATGQIAFDSEVIDQLKQAGRSMTLLSGDDPTFLPFLSLGGDGIISVASNLIPKQMVELQSLYDQGQTKEATRLHTQLYPLLRDLFVESNPVPLKYALSLSGLCSPVVRPPLAELAPANAEKLKQTLIRCGIGNRS